MTEEILEFPEQTTFNEEDMSIVYDENDNVIEVEEAEQYGIHYENN